MSAEELLRDLQSQGLLWNVDSGAPELSCTLGELDRLIQGWAQGEGLEPERSIRVKDGGEAGWARQDHTGETDGGISEGEHTALSADLRSELQERFPGSPALSYTFTREDTCAFRDYRNLSFPFTFHCPEQLATEEEEDMGGSGGGQSGGSSPSPPGSPPAKRQKGGQEGSSFDGWGVRLCWTEAECQAFEEKVLPTTHRFRGE